MLSKDKNNLLIEVLVNIGIYFVIILSFSTILLSKENKLNYLSIGLLLLSIGYFYVYHILAKKKLIIKYPFLFVLLLSYITIISLLGIIKGQYSIILFTFSSIILLIFFQQYFFPTNKKLIYNRIFGILVIIESISIILAFVSLYVINKSTEKYLTTIFLNRNTLGIILLWGYWANTIIQNKYINNKIVKVISIILFISIFLTGSRSSILALLIFWIFQNPIKRLIIISIVSIICLLLFGSVLEDYYRFEKGASHRDHLWKAGIESWEKSPIIGSGYNSHKKLMLQNHTIRTFAGGYLKNLSPHNTYIRYLIDFGIIGLALYLFIWGWVIIQLIHSRTHLAKINSGYIMGIMTHQFFETEFLFGLSYNNIMLLIFIYLSLSLNKLVEENDICKE
ncbi:MAG: O-antigen ligase family protein [Candidatus Cloacimonetes bacterium]|nr:O-antigen ligase family protein [Candidatus Cloacimonadota bacterium]MBL7086269.1 O-antigen ligase family protein [Candidatus Cloacimonadota bacterium]